MDTEDKAIVRHMFKLGRTAEEIELYLGYERRLIEREMKAAAQEARTKSRRENRLAAAEPIGMEEYDFRRSVAAASNDLFMQTLARLGNPSYA
jgi:hypothetical protein